MAETEGEVETFLQKQDRTMEAAPTFEDVLEKLGTPGKFHVIQLSMGLLCLSIMASSSMGFVFLGYEPHHVCNTVNETNFLSVHGLQNQSELEFTYQSCDVIISTNQNGSKTDIVKTSCPDGRNFSAAKHTTWLSEWDLVCESKGIAEMSFTLYNAGMVIGGLLASIFADRVGRKPVFVVGSFMCFLWEAAILFTQNIYVIQAFRFLSGMARNSFAEVYFVLGLEILTPKYRDTYGFVVYLVWVINIIVFGFLAYLFQNYHWEYYQATVAASGIFFVLYPLVVKESPRWLTTKNRFEDALAVLKTACRQNGTNFEDVKATYNEFVVNGLGKRFSEGTNIRELEQQGKYFTVENNDDVIKVKKSYSDCYSFFSNRHLVMVYLTVCFSWVAHTMTYFGLYLTSSSLAGNRFLNYILMAVVEIPANLIALIMMKKMKRIRVQIIFLSLSALSFLVCTLLSSLCGDSPEVAIAVTVVFIFGKLVITASFIVLYVLTPEVFPTAIRTTADATCGSLAKIGSMLVPYMRPLATVFPWLQGVVFTSLCGISLVLVIVLLPETKDKELPDTMADMNKIDVKMSKKRRERK